MICHLTMALLAVTADANTAVEPPKPECLREVLLSPPCGDPDTDPWVSELRDRVMSYNPLAHYAIQLYGPPTSCEGEVATEFAGAKFGVLRLAFVEGVTVDIETMPPETSVVTLRTNSGLPDEESARQVLEGYSTDVGLEIDWTAPTSTKEGGERQQTFWDPDPGVNGSASFIYREDILVSLQLAFAL